jgi:hypothetical protein
VSVGCLMARTSMLGCRRPEQVSAIPGRAHEEWNGFPEMTPGDVSDAVGTSHGARQTTQVGTLPSIKRGLDAAPSSAERSASALSHPWQQAD